ncbi:MAG: MSCRAMM family protein, partial [Candidatus Thorarchaeota archaeon]
MRRLQGAVAFLILTLVIAGSMSSMHLNPNKIIVTQTKAIPAATDLRVDVRVFNYQEEFNDDDFEFRVWNYTYEVQGANVTLWNSTDGTKYDSKVTDGTGYAIFYNLPNGTYKWNVTWSAAPGIVKDGQIVSNGPEVTVNWQVGNLDHDNDDDDLNATVLDVTGKPAEGLNFSVHFRDNNSIYTQLILGSSGVADITDIPDGNYTWKVTVVSGPYAGEVLKEANFTADGTLIIAHQLVGLLAGDMDFYDLEVFVAYETSDDPVAGATINLMFKNGTAIDSKVTENNGTVLFVDLPVAFVNWTITFGGNPIGDGMYSRNLTAQAYDVRSPVITSPGDQEFLIGPANLTITWHVYDEYPKEIRVYRNDNMVEQDTWTNSSFDYMLNVSEYDLGTYTIRLEAEDQNQHISEDTITLRIFENVTPVISHPDDVTFYYTESGNQIQWNVTDEHINKYTITRNGDQVASGTINPENPVITVSLNDLDIGVYTYLISVNDTSGNTANDSVIVTVKADDIAPTIVYAPKNFSCFIGDLGLRYNWTATDEFKDTYTITVDGLVVEKGDWTEENIWFDFGGLSQGQHVVTLTVTDLGGNTASSSVYVTVNPPLLVVFGTVIGGGATLVLLIAG